MGSPCLFSVPAIIAIWCLLCCEACQHGARRLWSCGWWLKVSWRIAVLEGCWAGEKWSGVPGRRAVRLKGHDARQCQAKCRNADRPSAFCPISTSDLRDDRREGERRAVGGKNGCRTFGVAGRKPGRAHPVAPRAPAPAGPVSWHDQSRWRGAISRAAGALRLFARVSRRQIVVPPCRKLTESGRECRTMRSGLGRGACR